MNIVLSVKESRRLDEIAVENGYSIRSLIASSGRKIAEHILASDYADKSILFVCGKGHNGADQIAAASELYATGKRDIAIFVPEGVRDSLSAETAYFYENTPVCVIEEIGDFDVYFDGLLGTGFSGEVEGEFRDVICALNEKGEQGAYVVSTDIPSGINGDSGKVCGVGVIADETLALAALKPGFYLNDAPDHCGKITLLDIGIDKNIYAQVETFAEIIDKTTAKNLLPKRNINSYKGSSGYLYMLSGSFSMMGAAITAGISAYRAGAGLVKIATKRDTIPHINCAFYDAVYEPLETDSCNNMTEENIDKVLSSTKGFDVALIGPGLSLQKCEENIICDIISNINIPIIVDASALTVIAKNNAENILNKRTAETIFTPHAGEMARLLRMSIEECENNRVLTTKIAARRFNATVVYKGGRAIIATPSGDIYFNPTGNGALAVAGSGDMLAGIIGGLLAGGLNPLNSALLGCFIGGTASEEFSKKYPEISSTASALTDFIGKAIMKLSE